MNTNDLERNPWKTLSSKEVYKNNWIRVREDQVIRPDGLPGIYGVVEARLAVAVLAFDADGKIVMIGQHRYPMDCYSWELVEGGAEDREDALETAKRELIEEAGFEAESWEPLASEVHLSNCYSSERGVFFVAKNLKPVNAAPEPTELLQIKHMEFSEVLSMIDAGKITDAFTIMGIMLWHRKHSKISV